MPPPSPDRVNGSLGTRLDCWKEIAAYLGKVERTVKRWDVDRGLPIHRVPGGGRASVYAYTSELDDWLKSTKLRESGAALETNRDDDLLVEPSSSAFGAADAPGVADSRVPELSPTRSVQRRSWVLALCGFLLACGFGITIYSAGMRKTGQSLFRTLPDVFASIHPKPVPGPSNSVSDSEKNQARDFYLRGRFEWDQRTPDSLNRALDSFTQAILHDPGYAPAYVGMADTYDLLREYSTMPDREAYARAIAAARKAVELDDSLAEAHRALAFSEWWGAWEFVDGEKEFRRAIELNPRDPIARKWYANVLSVQGRFAESLKENERAQELDPTSQSILADRGWMLFNAGKRDEGIALLKEVERSTPEFLSPHSYLMTISLELKDYPSYLKEGKKTAEVESDPVLKDIIESARAGYTQDGERGLLNNLYAKQEEYYRAGKLLGTTLAATCILMGKKQEALGLLEEAYNHHESNVLSCVSQADLLPLSDEPRYKALVEKINFSQRPQMAQPDTFTAENQLSFRAVSDGH
jgi:tetratricopeptide (TPR) repeat protein